jgi:hypothetical protein
MSASNTDFVDVFDPTTIANFGLHQRQFWSDMDGV